MLRVLPAILLAALAAVPAARAADGAARVALLSCATGLTPAERAVVYEGRMRRVAGTSRMQMRFALQMRRGSSGRWTAVPGPGLGAWVGSDPGVARYTFTKRIENLSAPATYRVLVRFRWLDARGDTAAGDRVTSRVCREPDLRPQLVPQRIDVGRVGDPALRRYVVGVRNAGQTAAEAFDVGLDVGGPLALGHVVDLGAGASTLVAFEGPRCEPGTTLAATVDPGELVDEADEADNALTVPCPLSAG